MKILIDEATVKLALEALELAQDNLRDHGDNCFLNDEGEYNRCFCGKDSLFNHLQFCVEELDQAIEQAQKQEPVGERKKHEPTIDLGRYAGTYGGYTTKQEPVAYGMWDTMLGFCKRMMMVRLDKGQDGCTVPLYTAPPRQPLVINGRDKAGEHIEKLLWEVIDIAAMFPEAKPDPRIWAHFMVYAPKLQPLSDEEIADIVGNCAADSGGWFRYHAFARAIEAAHGIKGEA